MSIDPHSAVITELGAPAERQRAEAAAFKRRQIKIHAACLRGARGWPGLVRRGEGEKPTAIAISRRGDARQINGG